MTTFAPPSQSTQKEEIHALSVADLKNSPQWVCWQPIASKDEPGHFSKPPVNPKTGRYAEPNNPATWATYEIAKTALAQSGGRWGGLGFMFCPGLLPVMGVDFDHCRNPETGEIDKWAWDLLTRLNSYTEISPSRTGIHVLILGEMPAIIDEKGVVSHPGKKHKFNDQAAIEMYSEGRHFTMTGQHLKGFPSEISPRKEQLQNIYREIFEKKTEPNPTQSASTSIDEILEELGRTTKEPRKLSDNEVIEKAMAAKNGDRFRRLWAGDKGDYENDWSRADQALCAMLAFWCQKDQTQIDCLFRQSGLMRDKWDEKHGGSTYGKKTIERACEACRNEYTGEERKERARSFSQSSSEQKSRKGLPEIIVSGDQLRETTQKALDALMQQDQVQPRLFIRAGKLVCIVRDEREKPLIHLVGETELRSLLTRSADYFKTRKIPHQESVELVPISPPREVVHDILGLSPHELPFKPLVGIIEAPAMRPDGTIISKSGYDAATRLYYCPQPGMERCQVPENPTKIDVDQALALLNDAFGDFPYASEADCTNALAAKLTPFVRPLIRRHVPLTLINAPKQGTGKGLLADAISTLSTGSGAAILTMPKDEAEWQKQITALLIGGASIVNIDNVAGRLQSSALDALLTSDIYRGRPLGQSVMLDLPNKTIWLATGNNVQLGGDLARRCYQIRLDPKVSRPWMREGFRHPDLISYLQEKRPEHVQALLTLARYWIIKGKPLDTSLPGLGTFNSWVQTIGGILSCAGISGFLGNLEELYESADDDSAQWSVFLETWSEIFGDQWIDVGTLVAKLKESEDAGSVLESENLAGSCSLNDSLPTDLQTVYKERPQSFSIRLGKALEKRVQTCYGEANLCLEKRLDPHRKKKVWRVVSTEFAGSAGSGLYARMEKNPQTQPLEKNNREDRNNYRNYPQENEEFTASDSSTSGFSPSSVSDSDYPQGEDYPQAGKVSDDEGLLDQVRAKVAGMSQCYWFVPESGLTKELVSPAEYVERLRFCLACGEQKRRQAALSEIEDRLEQRS